MKTTKKANSIRWFWRSFTVTFLILACFILLALGFLFCNQRMEKVILGEAPPFWHLFTD